MHEQGPGKEDPAPNTMEFDIMENESGSKKDIKSVFEKKENLNDSTGSAKSKMRSRIAGKAKVV